MNIIYTRGHSGSTFMYNIDNPGHWGSTFINNLYPGHWGSTFINNLYPGHWGSTFKNNIYTQGHWGVFSWKICILQDIERVLSWEKYILRILGEYFPEQYIYTPEHWGLFSWTTYIFQDSGGVLLESTSFITWALNVPKERSHLLHILGPE